VPIGDDGVVFDAAVVPPERGNEHDEIDIIVDDDTSSFAKLRKVTFLGLTAAPPEIVLDDDDGAASSSSSSSSSLDARALSEFLMEIGASSVSVTDSDTGTSEESPIFGSARDMLDDDDMTVLRSKYAMILPDAAVGRNLWTRCDVSAHFPYSFDVSYVVEAVRDAFDCGESVTHVAAADGEYEPETTTTTSSSSVVASSNGGPTLSYAVEDVPDLDWITHVQSSWEPIVTDGSKFVLRFPWHDDALVMRKCQEVERGRMMEGLRRKFDGGVKREGAVVHFEEYDDDREDDDLNNDGANAGVAAATTTMMREYVQIRLEGGIAFGTGEHPTTRMCLDWVRDRVEHSLMEPADTYESNANDADDEFTTRDLHFLDYGAGSGVLGIAAAAVVRDHTDRSRPRSRRPSSSSLTSLSSSSSSSSSNAPSTTTSKCGTRSITTVGIEIDADAIHIANDNARKNGINMRNYLPGFDTLDDEATSVVMRAMQRERNMDGSIRPIPDALNGNMYDLCAANILALPLVSLAPTIAKLVKSPGGEIGLSGVLKSQADMVLGAYGEFFDDVEVAGEDGGWVLITGKRK
jgi:ribosomal protein L11 methylase PrmA